VLIGSDFLHEATTHKIGTVRKLSTMYQQGATTRSLPTVEIEQNVFVPWTADYTTSITVLACKRC